jgi:hypothetical protein
VTTLKILARSCGAKVAGHPLTKAVCGPMFFLGAKVDCLGMDNDWFGDYAPVVAAGSAGLFIISTVISSYNKPRYEPVVKHLAQSVGYFVAGAPLAIVQLGTWLMCKKSLQEFDAEQIRQEIAPEWDPVMDGPANAYDSASPPPPPLPTSNGGNTRTMYRSHNGSLV